MGRSNLVNFATPQLRRGSIIVRQFGGFKPYFGCGIGLLQENQCGIQFLYCYAVAENWSLKERFYGFLLTS